jgi:hypothetical protein
MAREPLKNVGASVRARLLQRSRDERTDFQILLTRYALERLLYRLSQSAHRNRFVLKGAMLIQVDVGFGDAITPGPIEINYPALLDAPTPRVRAYPIETVVAEKFHALAVGGITNSRLKDYYDLWLIAETFELEGVPLAAAVRQTFARRETALPQEKPTGLSDAYVETWGGQWRTFLARERMAGVPEQLATVVADLERFLPPLIEEAEGDWRWKPRAGWIQGAPSA